MKNTARLFGLFCLLFSEQLLSQYQEDTIVVYDISSNTRNLIAPVSVPATVTAAHSNYSFGLFSGVQSLLTTIPQTNLLPNSSFTKLTKAANFYNTTNFPARTAVKINYYSNSVKRIVSGMLVGECMVVTAGHITLASGTGNGLNNFTFDSIRVLPAFDNGMLPTGFQSCLVEKVYVFKKSSVSSSVGDIALLKLSAPLGITLGYTGIGFDSDTAFIRNKLFHKFSYPAVKDFADTSIVYNGDTMCYNYGKIEYISVYYGTGGGAALPGQGGSTFLHFDGADYYNLGTLSYSANYMHYIITKGAFYQLNNILITESCPTNPAAIPYVALNKFSPSVYPNPVENSLFVNQSGELLGNITIRLFDFSGRCVRQLISSEQISELPRKGLPDGIYLLTVTDASNSSQSYKLVFE